jgi:hypothetical protein
MIRRKAKGPQPRLDLDKRSRSARSASHFAYKTRVAYVKWMWGPEARVLRKRG